MASSECTSMRSAKTRLAAEQSLQLGLQRIGQSVGERRQQNAGVGIRARQIDGPMQCDDRLARSGGTGHARRAGVVTFDPLPLLRVQEHSPLFPREIERTLQFLDVRHHAETALGVGMVERVRRGHGRLRYSRAARPLPVPAAPPRLLRADGPPAREVYPRWPIEHR